jgi:DNA-binding NarL/FixJ family response regulator
VVTTLSGAGSHEPPAGRGSAALRVVVADDHPLYRSGLARQLRASGIHVVAEVRNGESAISAVDRTSPDVVLMDLRMPVLSGLDATRRLIWQGAEARVVVLTVSIDEDDVIEAILEGASAYVLKDEPLQAVLDAIHTVAAGRAHLSPRVAMAMLRHIRGLADDPKRLAAVHVSSHELQLLDLVSKGKSIAEVGEEVLLRAPAVEEQLAAMLMKLQVEHRVHDEPRGKR